MKYKLLGIVPGLSKVLKSPQIPFFIVTHGNGGIHARQWRDLSFSFKVRHAKQSDVLTPHQESAPDLAFLCKLSSRLTANESLLLRGHINPLISLEQRGKIRISFRERNQNMMNSESPAALWEKNDSSCSQTEVPTCEGESGLVETNEEESSRPRPERVTQMGKTGSKKKLSASCQCVLEFVIFCLMQYREAEEFAINMFCRARYLFEALMAYSTPRVCHDKQGGSCKFTPDPLLLALLLGQPLGCDSRHRALAQLPGQAARAGLDPGQPDRGPGGGSCPQPCLWGSQPGQEAEHTPGQSPSPAPATGGRCQKEVGMWWGGVLGH